MWNFYIISLQMIKYLCVTTEKEYNKLAKKYELMNLESMKYISETRSFDRITKIAEKMV